MLVLSWALSAPSAPFSPRNISHAWKGSLIFFFFSFCFSDCWWFSWDGEDKSHFIRLQHPDAHKTWPVFLLLCLSWAFSGHWWTIMGPHSSWGFFNVCCSPVALQSYLPVPLDCFPITLPVATWWENCHHSLVFAFRTWVRSSGRWAQELRDTEAGQPLTPLSSKQTAFSSHLSVASP